MRKVITVDVMGLLATIERRDFDDCPIAGCTKVLREAEHLGLVKRNSSLRPWDGAERVCPVVLTDKGRSHLNNPDARLNAS